MKTCKCNGQLANSGDPACDTLASRTVKHIFVPLAKSDGTLNYIDPGTDVINAAFITAKLNHTDPLTRWYPTPSLKNVTDERGDAVVEEFEDGSKFFIKEGTRQHTSLMVKKGPHYLAQLQDYRCIATGVYEVGDDGGLTGERGEDGFIYPIAIEPGSYYAKLVKTTDTTIIKIMVSFDYAQTAQDHMLETIPSTEITGVDLRTIKGLFTVHLVEEVPPSTTAVTVRLNTEFGYSGDRETVKGLLITDFYAPDLTTASRIYNVTTAANVTPSSIVETPANSGIYVITYPAQSSGDVLRLYPKKNGYDFSEIYDGDHDLTAIP